MNRKLFALSILLLLSSTTWAKKTVGELLKQAEQSSRGGKSDQTTLKKAFTSLPETQIEFEKQTTFNLNSIKPPKGSELMRSDDNSDQAQYEKVLDEQIQELYKLTQKFKNSQNRGELWLRLAELYVEKSSLIDSRMQDDYDAKLKAFKQGKLKARPQLNQTNSREYNKKAIKLYEWFEKEFPKDAKMSQALFFLGYNYFELGQPDKGAAFYDRLNREFPSSPFVGEARFALGEYYFENEKWAKAYKEYSSLLKNRKHRLHNFAMYKGAWCLYRLGEYSSGLKYMETLIKQARSKEGSKAENLNKLESEALRDIVVFYAAEGSAQDATGYFQKLLETSDVSATTEKLAYYYSDRGDREASKVVFKKLIADKPANPKSFEYQYQIVQNYFYSKNSPQFKEELYRWIKDYGPQSSWYRSNEGQTDLINNSYKLRETTLRNWVLQQHQTAQNSRAPFSQKQAMEGYNLYIQEFPNSSQIADMHFYYGELLYDMSYYDEASQQYKWVLDNGANSRFYDKAGMNLIHAAEKSVPSDKDLQKKVGNSVDPIPLDPRVDRFIKAAQWHLEKFPNFPKNPEIKFRVGRLYYLHNQFDQAQVYFKDIVKSHPGTKYSEYSANLLLDIFSLRKDYIGLEKTGGELLAVPSIASSKAGQDIRGVIEKASFKRGQDLEIDKKYLESAQQFEAFAQQNKKSNLVAIAWFNAGVNYERVGKNVEAIKAYDQVLISKTDEAKPLQQKTRRLLARLYQDSAQFQEAAKLYLKAAEDKKDPLAANFIFNAAVMLEAVGQLDEAAQRYLEFSKMVRKNSEKQDALWSIAEIYRKSNNAHSAVTAYKNYLDLNSADAEKTIEAHYWIYYFLDKKNAPDAESWRAKTLAVQKRLARNGGQKYAARIRLEEARELFSKYKSVPIPNDSEKQKKAVDQKVDYLNQLTKSLNEIIRLDSAEEIVSSLTILGEANQHMAESIVRAAIPKGLNAEQEKQYRDGMAQFAKPFTEKASAAFKSAVEKGYDLEVYNDGFRSARHYMSQIDPQNYYDHSEQGFDTRYLNWVQ